MGRELPSTPNPDTLKAFVAKGIDRAGGRYRRRFAVRDAEGEPKHVDIVVGTNPDETETIVSFLLVDKVPLQGDVTQFDGSFFAKEFSVRRRGEELIPGTDCRELLHNGNVVPPESPAPVDGIFQKVVGESFFPSDEEFSDVLQILDCLHESDEVSEKGISMNEARERKRERREMHEYIRTMKREVHRLLTLAKKGRYGESFAPISSGKGYHAFYEMEEKKKIYLDASFDFLRYQTLSVEIEEANDSTFYSWDRFRPEELLIHKKNEHGILEIVSTTQAAKEALQKTLSELTESHVRPYPQIEDDEQW